MSVSTEALMTALRTRLLTFVPAVAADTLDTLLGGRLYVAQAPADVAYPYGVVRLMNRVQTPGFGGLRETGDVELLILSRPRSQQYAVENALDVADQALLEWWDVAAGAQWSGHRSRDMLPAAPEPMDREVVLGRWVCGYRCWPEYLTQYVVE